jgi:glutathione peroxidase
MINNTAMAENNFYEFTVNSIDGTQTPLTEFEGKVIMVVNTASLCGYTPQYEGLEALYEKYSTKGFVILGFPSNDFGSQEPGTNSQIKDFCHAQFGIKFPLFEKGSVRGPTKQPLFSYLTNEANPQLQKEIGWNFEKFLINREGKLVKRFDSSVKPDSEELKTAIENLL